jgi:hypothetical protein
MHSLIKRWLHSRSRLVDTAGDPARAMIAGLALATGARVWVAVVGGADVKLSIVILSQVSSLRSLSCDLRTYRGRNCGRNSSDGKDDDCEKLHVVDGAVQTR